MNDYSNKDHDAMPFYHEVPVVIPNPNLSVRLNHKPFARVNVFSTDVHIARDVSPALFSQILKGLDTILRASYRFDHAAWFLVALAGSSMRPSNRRCRAFHDDGILGIGIRGRVGELLSLRLRPVDESLPQATDGIMLSIPVCNLSIRDFGDFVGFGTLAKINDFLTQRVAFPFRKQFGPDEVIKSAHDQTATF